MKRYILLGALLYAISANADVWSLDSCINYAIEHNISVKAQGAEVRSSEINVISAKSQFLPMVNASAGQSWNFGRGLTAENTYANRNTSSTSWNAGLSIPVFSGLQNIRQLQQAKAGLKAVIERHEAIKDDIELNVIMAYLQVLYCTELHQVALHQVDLSKYQLSLQEALVEAGKIPEIDMLEARSQLAQDELSVTQAENNRILALVDLAQLLELDNIDDFEIKPLDDDVKMLYSVDDVYQNALVFNHAIRAARYNVDATEKGIALAQSGYVPKLSFSAGLGSSYYTVTGIEHASFSKQMKDNFNTYLGFSLNIPIFDGLTTRNSVKRARVQHVASKLQYDEAENQLFKSIQQAYHQAVAAEKKAASCVIAENAAIKAFEAMTEKYEMGRATPTEYQQAKVKALTATEERIQAYYEQILRLRILDFYNRR